MQFVFTKLRNTTAQCPEMILNKLEKTFIKTYTGLKSFFRDSKSVFLKILAVRTRNPPSRQLYCLAGGTHTLTARILRNTYLESLKKTL